MSLANILSEEAMKNAVEDCKDPDTFCYKKFFQLCGLSSKSEKEIEKVFQILDKDKSGYVEESELKYFLQWFDTSARTLTEKETKNFISAADDNNDGRIGVEEFHIMVSRSSAS